MLDEFSSTGNPFVVIVANGELPAHPTALTTLANANCIICCDGALRHLEALDIEPTVVVGDGDSLSPEHLKKYFDIFVSDTSTEYNDLTKAFNYCRSHHYANVVILGAFGLREDHALANMSLIMNNLSDFNIVAISNYGIFTPITKTTTFKSKVGQPVSVFSFTPETKITFQGLQYPVENRQFLQFWEGALNVAADSQFTIAFDEGKLLVYQAFKN